MQRVPEEGREKLRTVKTANLVKHPTHFKAQPRALQVEQTLWETHLFIYYKEGEKRPMTSV